MTLTPCAPCNCIPPYINKDQYEQNIQVILCAVLSALTSAGAGEATAANQVLEIAALNSILTQVTISAGAVTGAREQVNVSQINGTAPSMNNGTSDAGTLRVTIASNSTGTVAATQSGTWNVGVNNGAGASAVNIQDGGNSITVDGTVAISGTVPVSGTVAATQSGTWNITNISGTVSLPTGAATSALQTTGNTSLSTLAGGVTGSVYQTNVAQMNGVATTMGNGISGTGTQRVTLASDSTGTVAATQSGTWNITNISGTVSLPTGASTSALQTTGNTSLSTIAGAITASIMQANVSQINGVTPLMGNGASGTGAQRVTIANDSTGILAGVTTVTTLTGTTTLTPGTGATNLGKAEDAPHVSGDTGVFVLGVRSDASPVTYGALGDYTPLGLNFAGAVYVNVDKAYQTQTSSGLLKNEDDPHVSGDTGVAVWNVANEALSTFGADGDYTPHAVDTKGRGFVTGQVAHDAVNAGNPVMTGAEARSTDLAIVSSADATKLIATLNGKLIVNPYAVGAVSVVNTGTIATSGAHTILAAPGATLRYYITSITLSNTAATATLIVISEGANNILRISLAALTTKHLIFTYPLKGALNALIDLNTNNTNNLEYSIFGYTSTD